MFHFAIIFGILALSYAQNPEWQCIGMPDFARFPDWTDCQGYYVCHQNLSYQQYCKQGFKYDLRKEKCIRGSCPPCLCGPPTTGPTPPPPTSPDWNITTSMWDTTTSLWNTSTSLWNTSTPFWTTSTSLWNTTTPFWNTTSPVWNITTSIWDTTTPNWNTTTPDWITTTPTTPSWSTPTSIKPSGQAQNCRDHPPGAFLPDPKNCQNYYVCMADRTAQQEKCDNGLWWDQLNKVCDFPANVNCTAYESPPENNTFNIWSDI